MLARTDDYVVTLHRQNAIYCMTKRKLFLPLLMCASAAAGQDVWTVERCMQYAVEHNHSVRIQELSLDNLRAERLGAVGAFLPSASGSLSGQYNFGRAIDPETNTYTNVSTFYSGYGLSASLPVFDGLRRLHDFRTARANELMGRSQLIAERHRIALRVYESYADVLYCRGAVEMMKQKADQSRSLLRQTEVMREVGKKAEADVAQVRAQLAADELELTRQQNQLDQAMLRLREDMGLEGDGQFSEKNGQLIIGDGQFLAEDSAARRGNEPSSIVHSQLNPSLPELEAARRAVDVAQHNYRAARSGLMPQLSLGAGISTTYYKTLHTPGATPFGQQFRQNAGEYVYASLSIPIFDRLRNITTLRRRRNDVLIARERFYEKQQELRRLQHETELERRACLSELEQTARRLEADSLALSLARRQYEVGLSTPLEVQTRAAQLLESRAQMLRSRLTLRIKEKLLRYYQGEPPIE